MSYKIHTILRYQIYWKLILNIEVLNNLNFKINQIRRPLNCFPAKIKDNKFIQLALVSAQKYFLFLGDLSRYRETNKSNNNLASAKEYYLKAQRLIPSNGVPYNQLAFVVLHSVSFNESY